MKVSVIIPVYNSAKTIAQCLACVCVSAYQDIEVICVVDEGCRDNSLKIVQNAALSDNRIRVVINTHGWAAYARNRGLEKTTGKVVFFIDSDIFIAPDSVTRMINSFADGVGVVGGGILPDKVCTVYEKFEQKRIDNYFGADKAFIDCLPTSNLMVLKIILDKIDGFDEAFYFAEDFDLCLRAAALGYKILYDPAIVARHVHRDDLQGCLRRAFRYAQGGAHLMAKYYNTPIAKHVPFRYFPTPVLGTFVKYSPRLWLIGLVYNLIFFVGGLSGFLKYFGSPRFIPQGQCDSCR